jgi:hypothetical protein
MFLTQGQWHDVGILVDPTSRTWDFFLDGVFFNEIASLAGSYIDNVRIDTNPELQPVGPEPSSVVLAALGLLVFVGRRMSRIPTRR